jgi:putrescine transport system permease protein
MTGKGTPALTKSVTRESAGLLRRLLGSSPPQWLRGQLRRLLGLGRAAVIAIPFTWLLAFFLIPFVIVLKISLAEAEIAQPPYTPLFEWIEQQYLEIKLNLGNYRYLIEDSLYWKAYLNSVKIAGLSTLICLLIGYPMAYGIARARPDRRTLLLLLVILPFWTSFLIRVYAWIGILKTNGLINNLLMWLGLVNEPIVMLQTDFAVYLGIVYSYLPFMILPLYANLEKLDGTLLEAASDLGARPWRTFLSVTLPLSAPGILAGSMLVFIPAVGEFVIPALLGGPDTLMIGRVLWDEFFSNRDWPVASAVAIALLLLLVVPIVLFQQAQAKSTEAGR